MFELIKETFPGYVLGAISGFDGEWHSPTLQQFYGGDVWASAAPIIKHPQMEQFMAMIMETIIKAGYCGETGPERFGFIDLYFNHLMHGDAFDEHGRLINQDQISMLSDAKVIEFYDYFTQDPGRCMLRFAERIDQPRKTHAQDPILIGRLVRIEIALKVFFARNGIPEFCENHIPNGFLMIEEYVRKQKLMHP